MVEIKKGNAFKDITGNKYNYLTAISYVGKGKWLCNCDCGGTTIIRTGKLTGGYTKSCGCLYKTNALKHGLIDSSEYTIWCNMKARCYNPNNYAYSNYGRRGIKVCNEWLNSFESFFKDMGRRPIGYSLERIDNSSDYCKANCKWATKQEQAFNRRSNDIITYNNLNKPLKQWCDELHLSYKTIYARIHYLNWSIEDAFRQ